MGKRGMSVSIMNRVFVPVILVTLLGTGIALGIDDVVLNAGCIKGLLEKAAIIGFPPG